MSENVELMSDDPDAVRLRQIWFDAGRAKFEQQQQRNKVDAAAPKPGNWLPHAAESLKKVPNNRAYVLREPEQRALGAVLAAWQRRRVAEGSKGFTRGALPGSSRSGCRRISPA